MLFFPRVSLRLPRANSADWPRAKSTWEGSNEPELHALPPGHGVYSWVAGLDSWAAANQVIEPRRTGARGDMNGEAGNTGQAGEDFIPAKLKRKLRELGYVDP